LHNLSKSTNQRNINWLLSATQNSIALECESNYNEKYSTREQKNLIKKQKNWDK
jgi:hypothetical protein